MPRQWVQICVVTGSILRCPISSRLHLSCQEQRIRGWSVHLDPRSGNANPIRWKLNELWTQCPLPAAYLWGAHVNTHMMPTRRPFSSRGAPWIVLDWPCAIDVLWNHILLCYLRLDRDQEPSWCLLNRSHGARADIPSSPSSSEKASKCPGLLPSFPLLF